MDSKQQHTNAQLFAQRWAGRGDEKQDTHNFWHDLLLSVYGVSNPATVIQFEKRVHLSHTSFIDGYIATSKVLIEQKGMKIDLNKKERQSDGQELTPYEQAFRYASALPLDERPRYIVTCNFQSFQIYDQNNVDPLHQTPIIIELAELPKAYASLNFLTDLKDYARQAELDISTKAGVLIGKLYNALLKQYGEGAENDPQVLQELNKLCVRIVFCLYAEDAFLFPVKDQFATFLKSFSVDNINTGLEKLFAILNTKEENRSRTTQDKFLAFPYVNGGLFADSVYNVPEFSQEAADILIKECSEGFDWSGISPTIFGAMFESTLNPDTRRSGGMHYTSLENIHKVIDPLFLNELTAEYQAIEDKIFKERHLSDLKGTAARVSLLSEDRQQLIALQDKLASLKFLDPACGSGNFLTESYLCLRRIENKILSLLNGQQIDLFRDINVKVSLDQFYGIEINDFAVSVTKTALWIAEAQMLEETNNLLGCHLLFLPLKSFEHVFEGNALKLDWNEVVPANELNYIMGNPPFVGAKHMTSEQKKDATDVFGKIKLANSIDYVVAWFFKTSQFIQNTSVKAALVSTNSICQGEQVAPVWKKLQQSYGVKINFAYRTFEWDSEASDKAHVHCVIVGFSCDSLQHKVIYLEDGCCIKANNINGYLTDAVNCYIEKRSTPISDVPYMDYGNMANDGGNYILSPDERTQLISQDPDLENWIREFVGAAEFIKRQKRYCFWLKDISPAEIRKHPEIKKRVEAVKELRLQSSASATREKALVPHLFFYCSHPNSDYLLIPRVSSERREYIPIGFNHPDVIASDACSIVPNATLFHFAVLTSSVHNAWMRTVAGRLKSDYRYSGGVVYNNFIWPEADDAQKEQLAKTAQDILDARALYPDSSLADLYDPLLMPIELKKAHTANDKAVLKLYGFKTTASEEEIVAQLMQLYANKVATLDVKENKKTKK